MSSLLYILVDMERHIFDPNHVADIPKEKLAICYGWAYKGHGLKMTSTVLTVVGAALSPVLLLTLVISGVGLCVRAYSDLKNLQSRV